MELLVNSALLMTLSSSCSTRLQQYRHPWSCRQSPIWQPCRGIHSGDVVVDSGC